MKRIFAILLSVMFIITMLAACSGDSGGDTATPTPGGSANNGDVAPAGDGEEDAGPPVFTAPEYTLPEKEADVARYTADGRRHIIVGTWYQVYYDSTHESIFDNESESINVETAQMELDKVREIEEKYNVYLEFRDLTWEGIMEDIPVSIMSGIPSCDVYMVDLQFGVTPILSGMAAALEDMTDANPAYISDALAAGNNTVLTNLKIPGMDKTYMFRGAGIEQGMYMLGYNRDMIQAAGLEDPQELWYKGEWTWEAFRNHCKTLTDPDRDIYGYGGVWTQFLTQMLYTNDAAIAATSQQTIDDPKTLEVFTFINELYNVDKCARPWISDDVVDGGFWSANNDDPFMAGRSGFNITAAWINQEYLKNDPMPFEIGMVPFPVGPSGNWETVATVETGGNWFFIPRYIKDPGLVFDVMYEWHNWYDGDLEYRDDLEWLYNNLISDDNIDIYMDSVGRYGFDLWNKLSGTGFSMIELTGYDAVEPTYTPASFVETFRQVFQDALDRYFG